MFHFLNVYFFEAFYKKKEIVRLIFQLLLKISIENNLKIKNICLTENTKLSF